MGYSIHADTIEELLAHADALRVYVNPSDAAAPTEEATADKPKRTRKKAEAPDPIMPAETTAAPAPSPFVTAAPVPAPEPTPAPAPFVPAAAEAAPFNPAPIVDRPAVVKCRDQLELLGSQHGRAQVMAWAVKSAGLPASTSPDEFVTQLIHSLPDETLLGIYRQAGGA